MPCVGCPCVSLDLKGQACLAMHCSTGLSLYQNQHHRLIHSLANVSLLLIPEDKKEDQHLVTKTKSLLCLTEAGISCFTIFGKDVSG